MNRQDYCTAIVLAAGRGSRMGTTVQKQYLDLQGKPVLYYSLKAFENSSYIDEIILVTGEEEREYCRKEIVERYGFLKVHKIVAGGSERYFSVWNGIQAAEPGGYVFIHDGARPFVDEQMIERIYQQVRTKKACVAGMPAKDTIKIADENGVVKETPDRDRVWIVQTPQVFAWEIVREAYAMLMESGEAVTDDAMAVEKMLQYPVCLVQGSYENIKITTPEDLILADAFLKQKCEEMS